MRWLPSAERASTPWKNRGGLTWTIASDPMGASLADFQWRLSLARVETPGPFSRFEGVERHLALVEGGPLVLGFADDETSVTVTVGTGVCTFAGERPVVASLPSGSATDLNFMVRRGSCSALSQRSLAGPERLSGGLGGSIVVCLGAIKVEQRVLRWLDALWLAADEEVLLEPNAGGGDLWLASLPPSG